MSLRVCQMPWLSQLDCAVTSLLYIGHTLLLVPSYHFAIHPCTSLAHHRLYPIIPTHVLSRRIIRQPVYRSVPRGRLVLHSIQ